MFDDAISVINAEGAAGEARLISSVGRFLFQYQIPVLAKFAVPLRSKNTSSKRVPTTELISSPAWPEGCYSTLAGFVETGESLESAVIREVFEESGIVVENPVYIASQPWPFPQSIMLGYVATAVSSSIVLDRQELANADWFSVDELSRFGEWADEGQGLKLPRKDSIARFLIDSWVAKQQRVS